MRTLYILVLFVLLVVLLTACTGNVVRYCTPDSRAAYYYDTQCRDHSGGSDRAAFTGSRERPTEADNPQPAQPPEQEKPTSPERPERPDRAKGDASMNSGFSRTGRADNGRGQGRNRP